jgi:methionyl-tRNA formyltransferase
MGTPDFARRPLAHLCDSRHEVLAVVTGPDKVAGRGHKLIQTPVRIEAEKRDIPVFMPASLKSETLYENLRRLEPELIVVIAFRILPERLFSLPEFGAINIHASLLPKYRGAAPINWALINGESKTGVTSFFLKKEVDTGDMIAQETTAISQDDTYDTLAARLSELAGPFLLKTLDLIEQGGPTGIPQDDLRASPAPKLTPDNTMVDFGFPAVNVRNFVRGLSSKPAAYTTFRGAKLKLLAAELADGTGESGLRPGAIIPDKRRLLVQCRDSVIEVTRMVPAGKSEMDGASFVNGFHPNPHELLGDILPGGKEKS